MPKCVLEKLRRSSSETSSGYGSIAEQYGDDTLSESEARRVLEVCGSRGWPKAACRNSSRGCPVTSYTRILDLHQQFCTYQEVKKDTARGRLSLLRASPRFFQPFCKTFRDRGVVFLYKQTQDSIKICAQTQKKSEGAVKGESQEGTSFTLTFYDKEGYHFSHMKVKGLVGDSMYPVPAKVFKKVGPEVNYKIELHLPSNAK